MKIRQFQISARQVMAFCLKEGMTLAIEPLVSAGRPHTRTLADGWGVVTKDGGLAAHYEHTIVITEKGYEILTEIKEEEHPSNG